MKAWSGGPPERQDVRDSASPNLEIDYGADSEFLPEVFCEEGQSIFRIKAWRDGREQEKSVSEVLPDIWRTFQSQSHGGPV